ncbi:MAG: coproporphyrinogen III oxidase [Deltaproteobacteria bacterium HGW-Deltaproteobacteria-2]|jgi:oxygen-independent coproporphyrinogen-3 oxidase|nr:MAG: coproporphyrinogen III oxidase [Deltaproteobacteria bacterium HGW-Deltaproteobacteria-2]
MRSEQAGLYIHIPFCLSKCGYCSFYSIKSVKLIPEYIAALKKEIKYYRNVFSSFDTIYIGGGTPSLLTPKQFIEIFTSINKYFNIDINAEITLETNPGDISFNYLNKMKNLGINRLNIGVQSFDDKVLQLLGRRHSAKEAISAIEAAREAGFDNLGIDLIYGIHGVSIKSWENTLQKAVSFKPEHISCYQLSLDDRTPLYNKYSSEGWKLPDENTELKLFLTTAEELNNAGYIHYEVSNFARLDKFKSRHNQKYWQHVPYLGLGPAAHSFLNNNRWWNKAAVKTYLKKISQDKMPVENTETLSAEQLQLETLFLGLRTKAGIDLKRYKVKYGVDLLKDKKTIIDALIKNKLVELNDGFLRPTRKGMAVADSLALI